MVILADQRSIAVSSASKTEGGWDSIHVFEAVERGRMTTYKLTSTVILHLSTKAESFGEVDLSGNMTRQVEQMLAAHDDTMHLVNIGKVGLRECYLTRVSSAD